MEVERRKYQNDLRCCGIAIILFGVWDVMKGLAALTSNFNEWVLEQPEDILQVARSPGMRLILIFIMGTGALIVFWFHFWLGRGAISEARGKRLKRPYVAVSVIMAFVCADDIYIALRTVLLGGEGVWVAVNSIIFDLSYIIIIVQMVLAVRKVRGTTQLAEAKGE